MVTDIERLRIEDLDLKNAKIKVKSTGITNERILDLKAEQILLFYEYLKENRIALQSPKLIENNKKNEAKFLEKQKTSFFLLNKLGSKITADDINKLFDIVVFYYSVSFSFFRFFIHKNADLS